MLGLAGILSLAGCDQPPDVRVEVAVSPATVPPEGGSVNLLAVVTEEKEGPLSGTSVRFTASHGTLASNGAAVETDAAGQATDTLTVPAVEAGVDAVEVTATATEFNRVGTAEVAVQSRGGGR